MAFPTDAERQKWRVNSIWRGMIKRTTDPKHVEWKNYGGRGIKVCERWRTYQNFYDDMAPTYRRGMAIDRIDVNGDYEPGNCRWATTALQARNRRNNRMVTHDGRTLCLTDWAEEFGIPVDTVYRRMKRGWSVEKALFTPRQRRTWLPKPD
jgi:hypothetical protein